MSQTSSVPVPLLVLFRHGQTDYNAQRRFQGQSATPLNATGRDQARRTAEIMANVLEPMLLSGSKIVECISSDLPRAWETSQIVLQKCATRGVKLPDFLPCPALRELNIGLLQDYTVDEFEKKSPGVLGRFYAEYEQNPQDALYPGGESRALVAERLAPLLTPINPIDIPYPESKSVQELLKLPLAISVWSAHGAVMDIALELMGLNESTAQRIVGNGDILLLMPLKPFPKNGNFTLARKNGCTWQWKLLRHYQVGDSIAARIDTPKKEET